MTFHPPGLIIAGVAAVLLWILKFIAGKLKGKPVDEEERSRHTMVTRQLWGFSLERRWETTLVSIAWTRLVRLSPKHKPQPLVKFSPHHAP